MKRHFPSSRKAYNAGGNALMRVEALFLPSRERHRSQRTRRGRRGRERCPTRDGIL